MDLADELGLLVADESFDCWTSCKTEYDYARFFPEWWERDVDSWVRRDRNHPGLLMWCIGNEIYDTHAHPLLVGGPYAPGSRMIGERVYHRPKQWNVYQEETFHLDERLWGLATFGIELHAKIHIKGFAFRPGTRAWDALEARDCDMLYGDSYRKTDEGILDIGNNVSLVFQALDFGQKGCRRITIRGRTALENNSIHIRFRGEDGEEWRIVEFTRQEDWGEQSFALEPVYGMQDVTFLFLPGSRFDFGAFRFE